MCLAAVGGFALATTREDIESASAGRPSGTPIYMAPELLQQGKNSAASDVYALGIMLWEMLNEKNERAYECGPPFSQEDVLRGVRPSIGLLPESLRGIISQCWYADAAQRPTCATILVDLQRLQFNMAT
jgi:serine/threonine protein kinase